MLISEAARLTALPAGTRTIRSLSATRATCEAQTALHLRFDHFRFTAGTLNDLTDETRRRNASITAL